jgi:hypothetical protein
VNPVPNDAEDEAHGVTDAGSNDDKKQRGANIECPNNIHRFYEVQPEYEINQRLRPTNRHQERPQKVPPAQKRPKHQSCLVGINRLHNQLLGKMGIAFPTGIDYIRPEQSATPGNPLRQCRNEGYDEKTGNELFFAAAEPVGAILDLEF